jgi:hypothetical protein
MPLELTEDLNTCFPFLPFPGDALGLEAPLRGLMGSSPASTLRFFGGFGWLSSSSASFGGVETLSFGKIALALGAGQRPAGLTR